MKDNDHARVITKPPLIFLIAVLVGWGIHWIWPAAFSLTRSTSWLLGGAAIVLAVLLAAWSLIRFRRGEQNPDPQTPTPSLYTDGPYARSRNPIYVALAVLQVGIALIANIPWILLMVIPALMIVHFGIVIPEEAYLEERFGDNFREYRARVRRWI